MKIIKITYFGCIFGVIAATKLVFPHAISLLENKEEQAWVIENSEGVVKAYTRSVNSNNNLIYRCSGSGACAWVIRLQDTQCDSNELLTVSGYTDSFGGHCNSTSSLYITEINDSSFTQTLVEIGNINSGILTLDTGIRSDTLSNAQFKVNGVEKAIMEARTKANSLYAKVNNRKDSKKIFDGYEYIDYQPNYTTRWIANPTEASALAYTDAINTDNTLLYKCTDLNSCDWTLRLGKRGCSGNEFIFINDNKNMFGGYCQHGIQLLIINFNKDDPSFTEMITSMEGSNETTVVINSELSSDIVDSTESSRYEFSAFNIVGVKEAIADVQSKSKSLQVKRELYQEEKNIEYLKQTSSPETWSTAAAESNPDTSYQMRTMGTALEFYRLDNGRYPTQEQGLNALIEIPTLNPVPSTWGGPYIKLITNDPWGNRYRYRLLDENEFEIYSYGADNHPGGVINEADISSLNF